MSERLFKTTHLRIGWILLTALFALMGCEAPLNLSRVGEEKARSIHVFDHFKALASTADKVVVASDAGVLLISDHNAEQWQRIQLPTKASFIGITACPNGRFAAVDSRRTLWVSSAQADDWQAKPIDTEESALMGLACDSANTVWVGASFSTLLITSDFGNTWRSSTQDEDLLFTAIQFLDDGTAVIAGEFGTVMFSRDGNDWERTEPLPNEFYPMGLYFRDRQHGWVSGLSGTILHTADGGQSWERQQSDSTAPLYGFATAGNRLFVLGDNGTLLEYSGGEWRSVSALPRLSSYLIGAVPLDEHRLLLAGGAGTLKTLELDSNSARLADHGVGQ